jgi:hypothetical protein
MIIKSLIAGAVLMLPVAAFAQSSDAKYCSDMSAAYRGYTNTIDAEVARAMGSARAIRQPQFRFSRSTSGTTGSRCRRAPEGV